MRDTMVRSPYRAPHVSFSACAGIAETGPSTNDSPTACLAQRRGAWAAWRSSVVGVGVAGGKGLPPPAGVGDAYAAGIETEVGVEAGRILEPAPV